MITSIGLDIVENARLEKDVETFGDRFLDRILSPSEKSTYTSRQDKPQFLAGRFAAKEAVVKALGKYLEKKPPLSVIEIVNGPDGTPRLQLPEEIETRLNGARCLLSISHERQFSVAVAVFEEDR